MFREVTSSVNDPQSGPLDPVLEDDRQQRLDAAGASQAIESCKQQSSSDPPAVSLSVSDTRSH